MSRRHLGGLAAAALVGTALASVPHGAVAAAPTHGQNARALAAASAKRLIASHAPALKVSSHDTFRALPVQSSHGIQYAAYTRDYRGLPVVGGDFVVVTDADGQVLTTSVAQTHRVALRVGHPDGHQGTCGRPGAPAGLPRDRGHDPPTSWCGSTAPGRGSAGRPRSPATTARCPTSRASWSTRATVTCSSPASG